MHQPRRLFYRPVVWWHHHYNQDQPVIMEAKWLLRKTTIHQLKKCNFGSVFDLVIYCFSTISTFVNERKKCWAISERLVNERCILLRTGSVGCGNCALKICPDMLNEAVGWPLIDDGVLSRQVLYQIRLNTCLEHPSYCKGKTYTEGFLQQKYWFREPRRALLRPAWDKKLIKTRHVVSFAFIDSRDQWRYGVDSITRENNWKVCWRIESNLRLCRE